MLERVRLPKAATSRFPTRVVRTANCGLGCEPFSMRRKACLRHTKHPTPYQLSGLSWSTKDVVWRACFNLARSVRFQSGMRPPSYVNRHGGGLQWRRQVPGFLPPGRSSIRCLSLSQQWAGMGPFAPGIRGGIEWLKSCSIYAVYKWPERLDGSVI